MDCKKIVSLTGRDTYYEYRELTKVKDTSLQAYATKTRSLFGPVARSFDDEANAEWFIRSYLALKYVLASTVLGTSLLHAKEENLKVTLPYLNYYTLLNCARAFILTLPCVDWKGEKSIVLTHQNIINTTGDKLRRLDDVVARELGSLLLSGQQQRELFSYRFPASGLAVFGDDFLSASDVIDAARMLTELAQFNLSCLETAVLKLAQGPLRLGEHNDLWRLMQYETKTENLIDDDDFYRVGYFLKKYRRPSELVALATHGLLEDFFGAWVADDDGSRGYDPDRNWSLLLNLR